MMKTLLATFLMPWARLAMHLKRLKQLWAYAVAKVQCREVSASAVFMGSPEIHGTREISVGSNVLMYPGLYMETRDSGSIRIGDGVVCSRGVHLVAYEGLNIGPGTMIGEYTSVRDADHASPSAGQSLRECGHVARRIRIGSKVWIGRGVTILAGVTIGDGAVIAANAVVNADVEAGALVGGVPARVLRQPNGSFRPLEVVQ